VVHSTEVGGTLLRAYEKNKFLEVGLIRSHVEGDFFPIDPPDPIVMESHRKELLMFN